MDRIKFLKTKKLFKELDYIQSDYDYKTEVIGEADYEFISNINLFLDDYPDLKEIYTEHTNYEITSDILINSDLDLVEKEYIDKSPHIKKIYREIVKNTHPDIVKDKGLNEYYINATNFYESGDDIGIYKICIELDITKYLDFIDSKLIEEYIESLKKRILFLENTLTWSWINSDNENDKKEILVKYIQSRLQ